MLEMKIQDKKKTTPGDFKMVQIIKGIPHLQNI